MNARIILTATLVLALVGEAAVAESILNRRYTSTKLDGLWRNTLGATEPDPALFEILAPGPSAVEPVREAPAPDFGVPFDGDIIGESTPTGGTTIRHGFPVIPLPPAEAAVLNRRLAWAEIYLARYRHFEAVSTDGAEVLAALTSRQYAAALEAYLVNGRLYFSATDLPTKCARLQRMRALTAGALVGLDAEAPPAGWRLLVAIHAATAARLDGDALAELVCSVAPVRGRAETARLVETRVRERILQAVRTAVGDTLQLLEAKSTEFQTLVNDMDVPIASAEILELERVLGNASANLILVKEDQLEAGTTLATLANVDLGRLNQPGALAALTDGQARMDAMTTLIDEVLNALAELAEVVDDPTIRAELAPCADLRGAYRALDLSLDTGTLAQQLAGPYEGCIASARALVARFRAPSLDAALMAELARHVRQINENYLQTVTP